MSQYGSSSARPSRMYKPDSDKPAATQKASEPKAPQLYSSFLGTNSMTKEQLKELAGKFLEQIQKKDPQAIENEGVGVKALIEAIVQEAGPLYKQYEMTEEQMEGMYNIGYQAFHQGNFAQAVGAFRLLFLLNPVETKYIFSLGLSLEKMKKYFEAATAYMTNSCLEEENPIPTFRTGVCFLELGESAAARVMFRKAINQSKDNPHFQVVNERAQLFLSGLERDQEAKESKAPAKK